jgi:hypothetical protein
MSLPHRLAERLIGHAAAVMPVARRDWVLGMRAELIAIDAPGQALVFAAGCAWTAYQQRMSPMRIALLTVRLAVAAVALLTAAFHAFAPLNLLAIAVDLRRHGLDGWAGGMALLRGQTADQALASFAAIPVWQGAAMFGLAVAFAAAAWFLARWNPRALGIAVLAGLALHTANTLALLAAWPQPYLMHPAAAWLDYMAFVLLSLVALAIWGVDRLTRPTPTTA